MDWVALISTIITTLLPLIINKGPAASKVALQRRAIRYNKLAEDASDIYAAFALGELASLCECLAVCETQAEQQQLLAAANDGMARMGALMKEMNA
jgi:hypothetical protein